ncbi:MAG TPA: rhodanese-like domain-containing protein [Steroidobacteraceae bacterium]|nr:rhodanese-like domain-containing protein [Steroidobacteraceae bacterium]
MTARAALLATLVLAALLAAVPSWAGYTYVPAPGLPASDLVQPPELAALLADPSARKPLVLQVGAHVLYVQAHIPGSEYVGPGEDDAGLAALRSRVARLPRDASIVIYCGCCPWDHCRNIGGAYAQLKRMGFTRVKVLYIASNFVSNWVDAGYAVATGD